jgi:DNA (cytosine-5)-methyltransferase 1
MKTLYFIDLFSGIGGFHIALSKLGHKCLLASDINKYANEVYKKNHKLTPREDITKIPLDEIPDHDIVCAGFPCQPFSNAGEKKGFNDTRGTLFHNIANILEHKKPKYIILENVKHLVKHDKGNTYKVIKEKLNELGYALPKKDVILSPHLFGIPQRRERIYILGIRKDLIHSDELVFNFDDIKKKDLINILDENVDKKYRISDYELNILNAWEELKQELGEKISGFPIYIDYFEYSQPTENLQKWKQEYIIKNQIFYKENKEILDKWIDKYSVRNFNTRDRRFEWQAGKNYKSIWDTYIQLRQSGIRCKKPDYFPTLVAMVQTPIIGKFKRRLTPREAARLQSFPEDFEIDTNDHQAYKQFGNSVNVEVVKYLANKLLVV